MLALKRILVATDFSETSHEALRYGAALANEFRAKCYVLHVLPKAPAEDPGNTEFPLGLYETTRDAARKQLRQLMTEQEINELSPEFATLVGAPHLEIIRYAKDHDIDVIVMGTHGRTFVAHMLMGSVAEHVVRRAPCPVLTVRHPQHASGAPEETVAESAEAAT